MPVVSGRFEHVPVCIFLLFLSCGGSTTSASASESATAPDNSKVEHFADASQPARRVRIGLALGGGGTRGAAHVRVIKELERSGVPIDFIAGTSMGAIVGGLYSAGVSTEQIERKFENQSLMRSFMTVPLWIRIAIAPALLAPRFLGHKPYDGLYYGNKFRNYLRQSVPPDSRNVEALKVPFGAVALNIADGKISCLKTGDLATAMQASSAVPGLRKPVQIGTELYTDGGVAVNLPVKQVREMGADFVIAVCVDERIKRTPLDNFRKVGSVAQRVVNLQLESIDKVQGQDADVLIHPEVDGIGLISTDVADARKALDAGTAAILEAMPQIKKKLAERGFHVGLASTDTIH